MFSKKTNSDDHSEKSVSPFSICTWNVWFENTHNRQRMLRISQRIADKNPTFVGLQEVTPELFSYLRSTLGDIGYELFLQPNVAYGCAIAISKRDGTRTIANGFEPYRHTIMSRGLLWVEAHVPEVNGSIWFGTTHLESYIPGNDGSTNRQHQIRQVIKFCETEARSSENKGMIITGDLNWDDERKRSAGPDPNLLSIVNNDNNLYWQDAWLVNKAGQDGYTYDSKENPMLRGNLRRRFDRCLSYFPKNDENNNQNELGIHAAELVGKEEIEGFSYKKQIQPWGKPNAPVSYQIRPLAASDHFGLLVTFGDASQIPPVEASPAFKKRKYSKKK